MKPAISVENLGKCYRVSHESGPKGYRTLRESFVGLASAPLRRFRGIGTDGAFAEDFWALKDVNFDVKPGEVVGIIGHNGAGKSTLLKLLSRICKPSRGRACITGRLGSLLEVGTGFHPELTGRENVFFNGSILGMSRSEIARKFDEIVEFSGVSKFLDTPVKRYSSGMQVRLAFAVAAHLDPEILLVDEVLAVGDATYQRRCINRMAELADSGRTILFVSHNLEIIPRLCSRAILLKQGRIQSDGHAQTVTAEYLNEVAPQDDDLTTRPRSGDGRARFLSLQHVNPAGQPLHCHRSGDDLVLRAAIESKERIEGVAVAMILETIHGARVVTTWTEEAGFSVDLRPGLQVIECAMKAVRLRPGHKFNVRLWLARHNEIIDHLSHCRTIEVEQGDDTDHLSTDAYQGPVVYDQSWRNVS